MQPSRSEASDSEAEVLPLRPFQRRFIAQALRPGIDTAIWSAPRGNGKSWLAAHLLTRAMTPGDELFDQGAEYLLCAASIEQARITFRFVRENLERQENGASSYRFLDSLNRIGATHTETNTRLRVLSSSGKRALGIVRCPLLVADEPGSWEVVGGQLMHDAIATSAGKPGSPMRTVYVGTLAPASSGWWHDLVADGSRGSVYVQALLGDHKRWDQWPEIRRCNPLVEISPEFRRKLLEERDEARRDTRLKSRFLSYRLNLPSPSEETMLLNTSDWEAVCAREVPPPVGRPVLAVDLGGGRAWSAAVAIWENGRIEALALAPGIPTLEEQEKRDRVPRGVYRKLHDHGVLLIAEGLRVQPTSQLIDAALRAWGEPLGIVCDFFRLGELRDSVRGRFPIQTRRTRWSESSFDIRATRKMALDGPMSVAPSSRLLLAASLAATRVRLDEGNLRLVKRDTNNTGRDDVAAALVIGCGSLSRLPPPSRGGAYLGQVAT